MQPWRSACKSVKTVERQLFYKGKEEGGTTIINKEFSQLCVFCVECDSSLFWPPYTTLNDISLQFHPCHCKGYKTNFMDSPRILRSLEICYLFIYLFLIFIVIQLQLSAFSPHPSNPPQPNPPPSSASTLPLDFVHVSFIVVPVIPSPHVSSPLPPGYC